MKHPIILLPQAGILRMERAAVSWASLHWVRTYSPRVVPCLVTGGLPPYPHPLPLPVRLSGVL